MRLSIYLLIVVNAVIMAVSTATWMAGVLEWVVVPPMSGTGSPFPGMLFAFLVSCVAVAALYDLLFNWHPRLKLTDDDDVIDRFFHAVWNAIHWCAVFLIGGIFLVTARKDAVLRVTELILK